MGKENNLCEFIEDKYKNVNLNDKDYIDLKNIIKEVVANSKTPTNL